ncbi:F-box protein At5g07610-like [Juglans microcarpa x Juglans regia]|uniref:F-box protein At5g07610-like n=1 Tax=Juglans microcarpa x Juglans regia TaxID=2249226 RepID=UPI001B7E1F77|nr:F-box protein At5g07610-like [Juglans microcarpa x Juglans regia]
MEGKKVEVYHHCAHIERKDKIKETLRRRMETEADDKENDVTRPIDCEDILTEIFLRLPRKSFTQFKVVSKQWLEIISSDSFIRDYDTKNLPSLYSFYVKVQRTAHPIKLPSLSDDGRASSVVVEFHNFPRRYNSIIDSSNGLILYHSTDSDPFKPKAEKLKSFFFLRNPVTDQYFPIPVQPHGVLWPPSIRFGPTGEALAMGFAFDHSSNPPHLIVMEIFRMRRNILRVISYSSYTRRWDFKDHELALPNQLDPVKESEYFRLYGPSTFLNGKLHWVSFWSIILAYDVKGASFSVMEGPVNGYIFNERKTPGGVYLGKSRERLIFIQFSFAGVFDRLVSLWTLENHHSCRWIPGYQIRMNNMPAHLTNKFWPLVATDRMNNKILYLSLENNLYSYHVDKELFHCHTPDASEERHFYVFEMLYLLELPQCPRPILYNLYELPKFPPFIPPQHYFSALFGDGPFMGWHDFNDMLQSAAIP